MNKKSHKALASATVMSLVLTSTLAATNVQAAAEVTRMPGADRFTTAQTVAKKSFEKAENVVLVNGLGYADSVSATPFAKLKSAPILLTEASDKPSADLLATLTELGAKNIYIVGGKGVVTEAMEKELAKNYTMERIGGTSRYETNAEIAKKVLAETKAEKAVLVNGQDGYADALSVASIAATKGYPVIFGNKNNVPTVVKDAVKDVKEILAVGGEGVLPDAVIKTLEAKRIAKGADRFDTNLKVLEHFDGDFNFDNIFVAAGGDDNTSKFADALVASAAAAKHGAPVVLTGLGANKDNVDKSVKYVKDKMGDNTKVTIVGGTASVSDAIEKDLKGEKESTGKAEVQSIEALNLNQVKIVFASKVDEDAAKDVTNYEVDGDTLIREIKKDVNITQYANAKAVLQDDGRTVILTLADSQDQNDETTVKVKKGVLSEDKTKNIKEYEKDILFKDIVAPQVSKVSIRGNNKLIVEFSEAVFVKDVEGDKDAAKKLAEKFEINGQSIEGMGLNKDHSKVKDSLIFKDENGKYNAYVNKVEFYFDSALDSGKNELKVEDGTKDEILCDAAGFIIKEVTKEFKIEEVTSKPKVKSVKGGTDGKIYIDFDRAMDSETGQDSTSYYLNNDKLSDEKSNDYFAKVELKKDDTQVKITVDSSLIKTGSNVIEITDKIKDAYGNKVDDDTRISFTAEKDEEKPKVVSVQSIDAETIRVRFSEDVKHSHATNKSNYELKDSNGTDITNSDIDDIVAANGTEDDTNVYDIKMEKKLTGAKYTLKIKNVADTSDNVMDDYTATLNGEDDEAPTVDGVTQKQDEKKKVIIRFSEKMDRSSVRNSSNYRFIDKSDSNKIKDLPSKATISVASDDKTVTIEFPDSYENKIGGIIVKSDVKDLAGNKMEADYRNERMDDKLTVSYVDKSFKARRNGDNVEVELQFESAIDTVNLNKFKFGTSKITPDSRTISGDRVTFKFNDKEGANKAKEIKKLGASLTVSFDSDAATDKAGQDIKAESNVRVYDYFIAPELVPEEDNKYVGNEEWKVNVNNDDNATITIAFDTEIAELGNAYRDDFTFMADNGNELKVKDDVDVIGNTIIYTFEDITKLKNAKVITVKADKDNIDVRTKKDGANNEQKYKPTNDDINGWKLKIGENEATSIANVISQKEEAEKALDSSVKDLSKATTGTDFLAITADNLKVEDGVATADFSKSVNENIKAIYTKLESDGKITEGKVEGTGGLKDAKEYSIDSYVMNTLARYLRAIDNNDLVKEIEFNGVTYTSTGTSNKGSKWMSDAGKSLVSAIVDEQATVVRNVTFTVVDENGYSIDVNFVAKNVPEVADIDFTTGE